jgi:dephospho-CoA kinase
MKLFGLTGGVGMGKSTATKLLEDRGVAVVDTDIIAREVVQPGQEALEEVKKRFGNEIVGSDGQLRRGELARLVFADSEMRRDLELILHPRIRQVWRGRIERWRAEGKPMGVVVIPLLFETGAEKHFDATICMACRAETQHRRLLERGWTGEQIRSRIEAQFSVEKKMALADFVIWTEGEVDTNRLQLDRVISFL